MMLSKNKMHLLVTLAVLAVGVLGNVQATRMEGGVSRFITIRSLAETNETSSSNTTNTTDSTSGVESLW
eukprot:CAMPEP_0172482976 /NCGR_PEP_ID=MMETSP1066-20121228/9732_1 /TAXON_ID=671091 /ORGANISM="Coscinodiscus wailesii, Strain CCMP2513" /LENGTH=68 /DNA_ID=CAMNT_0013246565 /DNA_START=51 /DNA_END=254 /DNA_ORIENTATION=+